MSLIPQAEDETRLQQSAIQFLQSLKRTKRFEADGFAGLDPAVQEWVVRELDRPAFDSLVEIIPFQNLQAVYTRVIQSQSLDEYPNVIAALAEFHWGDSQDLLAFAFTHSDDQGVCDSAAEGLARTAQGLAMLMKAVGAGNDLQRSAAIKGISALNALDPREDLAAFLSAHLTHADPRVRRLCVAALHLARQLTPEQRSEALRDRHPSVRQGALSSMRAFDEATAAAFVTLLEDEKSNIVDDVLEILEQSRYKLDEDALASAILQELVVRDSGRPAEYFNPAIITSALQQLFARNARLYGQTMKHLADIAFADTGPVRRRAVLIAVAIDERGFGALVDELAAADPATAKDIMRLMTGSYEMSLIPGQISATNPGDVQQNAALQIRLLSQYHESGLLQAKQSFRWAIALTLLAFPLLIAMIYYVLANKVDSLTSIITSASTVIVQFIAGTLFYLYNQTRKQLTYYHQQMNQTQRFLLANSVADSLEADAKQRARLALVNTIASSDTSTPYREPPA